MKNTKQVKLFGMLVLAVLFLYGCAAKVPTTNSPASTNDSATTASSREAAKEEKKEEAYSPVGVWEYTVDTPDGGSAGIMRIIGEPGSYEASLETDQFGTLEVDDLDIVGTTMTGSIEVAGAIAEIEGDFDGDDFSGAVVMGDDVFPLEGTRTGR